MFIPKSKVTAWSLLVPTRPFLFLFGGYLVGLLLFASVRVAFLAQFFDRLPDVTVLDIARSFVIGARFDTVVVLAILLPLLLLLPFLPLRFKLVRIAAQIFLTTTFGLSTLLALADLRFFYYFDSHLNFQAVQGVDGGKTNWYLIVNEPMFFPFLIITGLATIALWFVFKGLYRRLLNIPDRRSWSIQVLFLIVGFALTFLGIRGRTALSTINWGVAYTSQNHFLNQLGLNGVYMLGRAFTEENADLRLAYLPESERYPFVPFTAGLDTVKTMLYQPGDEWLEPATSIKRLTPQPDAGFGFKPNVVVVLMESWSGRNTGTLGSPRDLTPHFDHLSADGILFTRFFATGTRTNYGMPGVLCGFPSLPGRSVMTRYNAHHPFVALSEILHDRGYYNLFAYGGDIVFDNAEGFFRTKRFDRLLGDSHFGLENVLAKWGVPDHVVFHKTIATMDSLPRPFQVTFLTLSNHEPFDLPDSSVQKYFDNADTSMIYNSQLYADFALNRFIEEVKSKPLFDSTIFVFTADHAKFRGSMLALDPHDFHIPLLIYSPRLLKGRESRVATVGSQIDILPTLMGLLGGDYIHESWGRNLLSLPAEDSGFAVMNSMDRCAYLEDNLFYLEILGAATTLYDAESLKSKFIELTQQRPLDFLRCQRRMRIFMQVAEQLSTPVLD